MNVRSRVLAGASGGVVFGLVLALFTGGAANAYTDPGGPPDNTGAWRFGVPWSEIPSGPESACPTNGGWLNGHSGVSQGTSGATANPNQPLAFCIGEPYKVGTGIGAQAFTQWMKDNRSGSQSSQIRESNMLADGSTPIKIRCQSTQYAKGADGFDVQPQQLQGVVVNSTVNADGTQSSVGPFWGSINASNCPFLVYLAIGLGIYNGPTIAYTTWIWYADNARTGQGYAPWSPTVDICKSNGGSATNPVSPNCPFVKGGVTDPTDPNQVCANPPLLQGWGSSIFPDLGGWVVQLVPFYVQCMFRPAMGFDWKNQIAPAFNAGAIGHIVSPITTTINSLNIPESCGNLMPSAVATPLKTMSMNTCGWTWAAPVKTFLSVALPAGFGLWIITAIIALITGVMSRTTPSPVASEGESK